ncbi:MAG: VanZ family protein [Bacteroidales bacterium]|nr:VanZ family protein [Bacteroidales bacterium]
MKILHAILVRSNYRYFAMGWALLIIIISTIPNLPQPEIKPEKDYPIRLDYFFHFMVYFVLAFLVIIWQVNDQIKIRPCRFIIIIFIGLLFGFIDEWHQMLIPGRRYNTVDFVSNALGFISGMVFTYHFLLQFLVVRKNKFKTIAGQLFRAC